MGYSNITIQYYLGICLTFLSTRAFRGIEIPNFEKQTYIEISALITVCQVPNFVRTEHLNYGVLMCHFGLFWVIMAHFAKMILAHYEFILANTMI